MDILMSQIKYSSSDNYRPSFSCFFRLTLVALTLVIGSGCQTRTTSPVESTERNLSEGTGLTKRQTIRYQQALSHLKNKNYSNAQGILEGLIEERHDLAGPYANLGLIHMMQKSPTKALFYVEKSLAINSQLAEALNLMGLLHVHNRNVKAAETSYKQAIKSKMKYENAHYNLALLYDIYLQDTEQAIIYYRKYLALNKNKDKNTLNWLEQLERSISSES